MSKIFNRIFFFCDEMIHSLHADLKNKHYQNVLSSEAVITGRSALEKSEMILMYVVMTVSSD